MYYFTIIQTVVDFWNLCQDMSVVNMNALILTQQ